MNAPAARTRPVRVVIVDDTFDLRELLRLALTRGGMEVVGEAGDGLAGIEAVRTERPDVVLLDLSMPVMDGLEALPSIRRLVPTAKIIVLSGFGATQMSERALATGADGYLQKGMSLKRILEYVQTIVGDAPAAPSVPTPAVPPPSLTLVPPPPADPAPATQASAAAAFASGEGTAPTEPRPNIDRRSSTRPDVSAWEALALSPYGVLEVADEPLFRIIHANPAAQRLLENRARNGVALGTIAPLLANLVAFNRLDGEASFVADVNGVGVHAELRRAERSLLVYLDSTAEDIGVLRRAIATTAHEIRGPVAVLCGIAESIVAEGDEMSEQQLGRLMSSVTRQARVLDSITADLLTAAELQRGALRLDTQPVLPLDVIDAVLDDRFIVTVNAVVDDDRQVLADPLRLEQMLGNLLGNALKYGRAPFVVSVRPDLDDPDLVAIDVTDSGDGVPEEFRESLFSEFTRAGGSVATGTGLGLYVVRSLTEAMGGVASYSTAASGGACFTLSLPAV
ncbi:hybrid sensor histidine kinase/response regulator [Nocardioides anomalus]|uniref:histidine kinase n=1 Tax=Nocardioides anomalus TaxID=2712223 RepID=A0A6G6WHX4_9ACTN|nr:response regulator [Nocardioides anomalus]QIG44844.1 hybrid sensor histidine kinase/response regulator [Nocardioides anomalus]